MNFLELKQKKISGENLFHLTFNAPEELLSSYTTPGQYIILQQKEEKGFYALASHPNDNSIELLIKNQPGLSEKICLMETGDRIDSSTAQGNGFSLEKGEGKHVHLFSMGSGLAPFRPVIQSFLSQSFCPAGLFLWQGSFSKKHLPFAEEYDTWQKGGVQLTCCLDQEEGEVSKGNVAEVLKKQKPDLQDAVCFHIGSKEFGQIIKETCKSLGLAEGNLLSNY